MSQYYNPKRTSNLFNPHNKQPFRLSRSKIDLFIGCPRCFYLDRRLGTGRPPGYPFSLNSAVDYLLKKEFDIHRAKHQAHPLMEQYGIKAVPFDHPALNNWRNNFKGIETFLPKLNLLIFGAIDDVWINEQQELIVVDYKSTSVDKEITLDDEWKIAYKRQMEIYQWILRRDERNHHQVSNLGYFVYCNGKKDKRAFDGKLEFDIKIIPYQGDDSWISETIEQAHQCLMSEQIPPASPDCDYCRYRQAVNELENKPKENKLF